jgi:predicted YcjX-like family ATPase
VKIIACKPGGRYILPGNTTGSPIDVFKPQKQNNLATTGANGAFRVVLQAKFCAGKFYFFGNPGGTSHPGVLKTMRRIFPPP